jgi:hypothetical protein
VIAASNRVETYLLPLVNMTGMRELKDFMAIGARECTDPKEAERGILREFLDAPAKRFLECFARALPANKKVSARCQSARRRF